MQIAGRSRQELEIVRDGFGLMAQSEDTGPQPQHGIATARTASAELRFDHTANFELAKRPRAVFKGLAIIVTSHLKQFKWCNYVHSKHKKN